MSKLAAVGMALAVACFALFSVHASAQQKPLKDQVVGIWLLVSVSNTAPDGTKRDLYGADPKGILIVDASGHFSQTMVRNNRPKFAANNRLQGTAEEYKAAIAGSYSAFGKWSVDEGEKTFIRQIEGAPSYPNDEGRSQKWVVAEIGDQMTANLPNPSAGGKTTIVWKRVK